MNKTRKERPCRKVPGNLLSRPTSREYEGSKFYTLHKETFLNSRIIPTLFKRMAHYKRSVFQFPFTVLNTGSIQRLGKGGEESPIQPLNTNSLLGGGVSTCRTEGAFFQKKRMSVSVGVRGQGPRSKPLESFIPSEGKVASRSGLREGESPW